jgi:hypothetical protein
MHRRRDYSINTRIKQYDPGKPSVLPDLHLQSIFHHLSMTLKNAILSTLAYSDIFDHPLTIDEIHRFLVIPARKEDVASCLKELSMLSQSREYYFLPGRQDLVQIRVRRESLSRKAYERACWYGRLLGGLPFVRMVALTGSLAMSNSEQAGDYDYMLVAAQGRVWTARIFALLLNKFANVFGETICPNLIVAETVLEWKIHNLYSAHEIVQMILIAGRSVYNDLRVVNNWVLEYLPNWEIDRETNLNEQTSILKKLAEYILSGKLGDRFEAWEMNRKITKFSIQNGYGIETNFNADMCQGNFDHHGAWTMQQYQDRLETLGLTK